MLIVPIIIVIILSSLVIAYVSYEKNKKVTMQSVELQMRSATEVIKEKITMLKATVPKQQFNKKLSYALTQNKNTFQSTGLTPKQFKLTKEKDIQPFEEFNSTIPKLSKSIINEIYQKRKGVIHDNGLTLAFSQQVELDGSIYVIALTDREYLKPVYIYRNLLVGITSITILLSSIVGLFTIHKVTKPILLLKNLMEKVSEGNLETRINVGHSSKEMFSLSIGFNQMVERLHSLMIHLEESANQVTHSSNRLRVISSNSRLASEQIAAALEEVAGGANSQVDSSMLSIKHVSKISNNMIQASSSINNVGNSAGMAMEKAKAGTQLVNQTVNQINLVQVSVGKTAEMIKSLQEKSKQIDHILNLINDIASLTNLLSLNATIEAARAGEHGKGFAIVAQEVKKLSDQSGRAVQQIKEITDGIRIETEEVVMSVSQGLEVLKDGMNMVHQTESAFCDINNAVEIVANESKDVSSLVHGVTMQTKKLVDQMNDILAISQRFAGTMQHISAAGEEQQASMDEVSSETHALHHLAQELEKAMNQFKL
ncbi:methyl-accepting chemotaxis protein [Heyndrickxia sporothermodurans]